MCSLSQVSDNAALQSLQAQRQNLPCHIRTDHKILCASHDALVLGRGAGSAANDTGMTCNAHHCPRMGLNWCCKAVIIDNKLYVYA